MRLVNRFVVLVTMVAAIVTATTVVWMEVRQEREFRRLIALGNEALNADRTSEAIEAFSGALAFKPDSMLAHLQRAETYRRRGDPDLSAALRDAREAHTLDPTAPQPIELLGDIHSAMARYQEAVGFYNQYLQLDDRGARVLYKLAMAHMRDGRARDAVAPLRRALELDDRSAEAHQLMGLALREAGQNDEALRELNRAVALNGALVPAREELAAFHLARGRLRDAVEQLEAIAALDPQPGRLVDVALTLARSGQRDAAVVTLVRAAEKHPNSPTILAALGRVWLEIAVADEDPVALRKATLALQPLARRPDATSEVLTLLAEALLLSDQVTEAERTLQQAITRQPVEPAAFRHLADIARRRGRPQLAREAEARYAALIPDP
jgi:tetratricopeptide (TPR) repeat protein